MAPPSQDPYGRPVRLRLLRDLEPTPRPALAGTLCGVVQAFPTGLSPGTAPRGYLTHSIGGGRSGRQRHSAARIVSPGRSARTDRDGRLQGRGEERLGVSAVKMPGVSKPSMLDADWRRVIVDQFLRARQSPALAGRCQVVERIGEWLGTLVPVAQDIRLSSSASPNRGGACFVLCLTKPPDGPAHHCPAGSQSASTLPRVSLTIVPPRYRRNAPVSDAMRYLFRQKQVSVTIRMSLVSATDGYYVSSLTSLHPRRRLCNSPPAWLSRGPPG